MRTVVIGIGNPVRTDDGAGLVISKLVGEGLAVRGAISVRQLHSGGLRLMEAMAGFDRAIVIDASVAGRGRPGEIRHFPIERLVETRNTACAHDTSIAVAMELGREAGLALPSEVSFWSVEAADVNTMSETLTPPVAAAVPLVAEAILKELNA